MLKSLPTTVTTANLNAMLDAIEKLPGAAINRSEFSVTVHATKKLTGEVVKVLSAITSDSKLWSVRAAPGLITQV